MGHAEIIARISLFSMLKKRDIKRIAKRAQLHFYKKGDAIIREGERDGRVFILIKGKVKVVIGTGTANEKKIGMFGPDNYFGEMAVLDDYVRTASVIAVRDTQALSLDHWNIRDEIAKYPSIAIELIQTLSRRLREAHGQMI
ncbi:cyclic nucleotide-binding domain-containing protein [Desulfococcaceae bacterium HSG9]|nr:cyclic nucleotide-binding domain-containing protein [Desulfococcaceae bacterium HSG9]